MPPPTNTTPATAIDLGARPVALTIDVTGLPGGGELWYRVTAAPGEFAMGLSAVASPGGAYTLLSIYSDAGTTLYLDLATHNRLQMPVTPGTTYHLQISGVPGGSTSVLLRVEVAANVATTSWSLAINDDTPGFPLVVHSPVDGAVLQTRPFPAGEAAHVLPSGPSLWHDTGPSTGALRLYDATLTLQTSPAWTFSGAPPITSNRVNTFYVGDPGGGGANARITTVGTTGTLGSTVWTLPFTGMTALAVSRDETIAYLTGQTSSLDSQVRRWSLTSSTYLTPLAAAVTGYIVTNPILVLDDDTILVGYKKTGTPVDSYVRRYSDAGTLLHTYPFGAVTLDHLTHHTSDTAFWVWLHLTGAASGTSRFLQIQVSDGAILTTFDGAIYEGGIYQGPQPPVALFGHSSSCQIALVPPLAAYGGGDVEIPPDTTFTTYPIRRLRRAPHVNAENLRVFYRKFELDLERGQGAVSGDGMNPTVALRLSRDGGQTWGQPLTLAAGALGAYTTRAIAWRLGHARDMVFEVSVTDPIAWSLVQAWLDLEAGTN